MRITVPVQASSAAAESSHLATFLAQENIERVHHFCRCFHARQIGSKQASARRKKIKAVTFSGLLFPSLLRDQPLSFAPHEPAQEIEGHLLRVGGEAADPHGAAHLSHRVLGKQEHLDRRDERRAPFDLPSWSSSSSSQDINTGLAVKTTMIGRPPLPNHATQTT